MAAFTERAIAECFMSLLNEKTLDKITVKDIVDTCGINRSTFYYYYEDVYDLLNKILEFETGKITESHKECDTWVEGVEEAMSFALMNKKAVMHIYKSVSREKLEKYIRSVVSSAMISAIRHQAKDTDASQDDIALVADVYMYMLVGMIFKWLEDGMLEEPMDTIRKLGFLLEGNIHEMLLRAGKYKK